MIQIEHLMHPDTLRQLIANCRSPKGRSLGFPRDWRPHSIPNPDYPAMPLTDASAWEFIADYLESGRPYYEMTLNTPPGATAIYFETLIVEQPLVYVKVQIGARNTAIGRSFHQTERHGAKHESDH